MGMMLPNELIWIMEKLGFEWPDIDEDELRRGGVIINSVASIATTASTLVTNST